MTFVLTTMLVMMMIFTVTIKGEAKQSESQDEAIAIQEIPADEISVLLNGYDMKVVSLEGHEDLLSIQEGLNAGKMGNQELSLFATVNSFMDLERPELGQMVVFLKKK